ncbi:MAG: tRNA (adenosine(37)-N6)-dimethylallyltransferase MiaA [Rickettsiales bacterium]|nr:tRNA (adenosine(37)-N6)-dimethylallyltransferase MiaA [Rickettsiales bacterium]
MKQRIVIISGPTASGKSGLALDFALQKDIVIINADSLQIYEGLPILSSQPTASDQKKAEHRLYSILKFDDNSSVGIWLKLVEGVIRDAWQQNKLPVIVGGTGMYISKLVEGINEIPEIDEVIKKNSRELFDEIGIENFREELISLGEEEVKIKILDKQRLIRVHEVLKQTGKSLFWWQNQPNKKLFESDVFTHVNLNPNREELYKNCNLRFEMMLKNGAIEDVEELMDKPFIDKLPISKTLGFIEIVDFLNKKISYEEAVKIASQKTRNYAKRQLTWFRHQLPEKMVFEDRNEALNYLKKQLSS